MRVRVLGSAAGGGFPQWNCRCVQCEAARLGTHARPRTQSSIAIRGHEGPWFLVNASPDARQQLEGLSPERTDGVRAAPVAGVLLTDAEIDHTAGLLLLRESTTPVQIFGDQGVAQALTRGFPILEMLPHYAGAQFHTLESGRETSLPGSSLVVESFRAGGDTPLYLEGSGVELEASGLRFSDSTGPGTVTYVPGMAELRAEVLERFGHSDLVLVDGTFWDDEEPTRLGISKRSAREMGHVPLSGPGGTLAALQQLERPRKILIHINNTNPILLENSPQRDQVTQAGLEVAYDGLEVQV